MSLGTDIRHAARGLALRPGFTLLAALTLAMGIAATTVMFAVVHHLFVAPLPFAGAEQLRFVWRFSGDMKMAPDLLHIRAWQDGAGNVEWVEPFERRRFAVRFEGEQAEVVPGGAITPLLAGRLGIAPLLGRDFSNEDVTAGAEPVVLLGESLWRDRFGGDRGVMGSALRIDGELRTIIGVMPAALAAHHQQDRDAKLWVPFIPDPSAPAVMADAMAKLAAGVTDAQAQVQLEQIAEATPLPFPVPGEWQTTLVQPMAVGDSSRRAVLILFGAVCLVLLIACANVSGMLLARGADRRQELAVRAALGASGGRISRLLLVESAWIAAAAALCGIVLSHWGIDLIRALRPNEMRSLDALRIAPAVTAFAILAALLAAVAAGLMPALQARHADLIAAMRGGRSEQPGGLRLRRILVAGEIAVSVVLVLGAVLLIQTVRNLHAQDLGFTPGGVLTVDFRLPADRYPDAAARQAFTERVLAGVRTMPGVVSASAATGSPPRGTIVFGSLTIEGSDAQPAPAAPVPLSPGDAEYLRTLGVPLRAGRYLMQRDPEEKPVIVNESFARRHWTPEEAIGRRLRVSGLGWFTIVGVAADVRTGPHAATEPVQLYTTINYSVPSFRMLVRVTPDRKPLAALAGVRGLVHQIDPELPLRDASTLDQQLAGTIARERFMTRLLTTFGVFALALAVTGLYGEIAYAVARRTREIGVRMALGASRRSVHLMLLRENATLVLSGLVIGSVVAMWTTSLMRSLLYGTAPHDPAAMAITAATIVVAAGVATWLPARRATRVDPQIAMRAE
jgi:putative ABC transport system permease protein